MRATLFGILTVVGLAAANAVPPSLDQDPSAPTDKPPLPTRPLEWGDVNVLHTTDIHGWISGHSKNVYPDLSWSGDFGDLFSFAHHMRNIAAKRGSDLLLVDTGDRRIGHGLTDHVLDPMTNINGQNVSRLYHIVGYNLAVPGNHDLQNENVVKFTMDKLVKLWGDKYLTSNVNRKDGTPLGARFRYWESPMGKKMMAFGVVPNKTSPPKELLQPVVPINNMVGQKWFKDAIKPNPTRPVDVFVVSGHVDPQETNKEDNIKLIYDAIREQHPLTPILIFAGHTHKRWCKTFQGKLGSTRSMLIQSGRYFDTVGWMSVKLDNNKIPRNLTFSRRYLDNNVGTYMYHTGKNEAQFHTRMGGLISKYIEKIEESEALSKVYGQIDRGYYLDRKNWTEKEEDKNSLFSFYLNAVATTLVDPKRSPNWLFFSNWGIVRGDIYQGSFTMSDLYAISPDASDKSLFYYTTVPRRIADQIVEMTQQVDYDKKKAKTDPKPEPKRFEVIRDDSQAHFSSPPEASNATTYGWVTEDDCNAYGHGDDVSHVKIPKVDFDNTESGLPVYFWRKKYGSELGLDESVHIIVTKRAGKSLVPDALKRLGIADRKLEPYRTDVNQHNLLLEYIQNNFPSTPSHPGEKDA